MLRDDGSPTAGFVWYSVAEAGPARGAKPGTAFDAVEGLVAVGADGAYAIRLNPEELAPPYWLPGNRILVNMVAEVDGEQMQWGTTVDLSRTASTAPWVAGRTTPSAPAQPLALDFDFGAKEGTAAQRSIAGDAVPLATGAAMKAPASASLAHRAPGTCTNTYGKKTKPLEKFMRVMNWAGAPADVTQGTESTHSLGIGTTSSFAGGVWKAGGQMAVTSNIDETIHDVVSKWIMNKVNYQDRIYTCSDGRGHTTKYTYREGRGVNTAFDKMPKLGTYEKLTRHCKLREPGYELTKKKAVNETVTAGVDLGPINVNAQSGWNEGTRFFVETTRKSWVCWSNGEGIGASSIVQFRKNRFRTEPCGRNGGVGARCRPSGERMQ
ncbi:hypothetical protein AB0N29_01765 [Nocardioides sp. NPDC092400]|uniref:hypothetical protein n=1 Tax=Nocardioides sp. NPDC092400 TaxID=3155196 RepID=UPI00342CD36F